MTSKQRMTSGTAVGWPRLYRELPAWNSIAAVVAYGTPPLPGCVPVALRVYPVSLLPRDRLIEQLYREITALKEELENFKAEVGGSQVGRIRPTGDVA